MKITYLLFLSCLFYVSIYDVRGNARKNIIEEFKKHFKEYVNQNASNLTCFQLLKNRFDVCPCAIEQLQKLKYDLQNQQTTEVVLMTTNLQALIDDFMKSGKPKDRTRQRGKQEGCKFECFNPEHVEQKIQDFFCSLNKRKCFKDSK